MNAMVQTLNTAGRGFVGTAVPMLIQSSLLILILLAVNSILRTRVRAVFRYWIWMLVLVKLMLPPSLWSPVSLGTWFGDTLEVPTAALLEAPELSPVKSTPADLSPVVTGIFSQPQRMFVDPPRPEPMTAPPSPLPAEAAKRAAPMGLPPAVSLNWRGFALLVWLAVVAALLLLLAQRTFFVRSLVAQAQQAGGAMLRELDECRRRLGVRRPIALRLSSSAVSPAVCGLIRPVILVPQNLAARLHGTDLQAVLFHELAHVKRGDLWINLVQTLLQIVYFYNPLLWLANAIIRRIREKAVDETVLVALGEAAPQYPETLVNVAKLAFRRPALSLRLIGVVESKSALTSRIKHILSRPLPKTAKLGAVGLATVALIAAVLLPMAQGKDISASVKAGEDQILVVRWMAVLADKAAQQFLSQAQPVASKSQSYQAVRLESDDLLAGVRDCNKKNQVLDVIRDLKWVEPSPKYLRADSWSSTNNLKHAVYSQCGMGGAGPYKLDVRPKEAGLDLRYEFVQCALNPGVDATGSIYFQGSLTPGQALIFVAPLQKGGQTVATHLVVWQAVRVPEEDVSRVRSILSTSHWIETWPTVLSLSQGESAGKSQDAPSNNTAAQDGLRDSDGDGLSDFDEIHKYLTDPTKKDSDGDGVPDGDWNDRREYTYSVRTVLRYMLPFDEKGLNDDFQDGRVLKRTDDYVEVEFIHYPFATGQESIPENRNWRQDDARMTEYLAPGPSTNWDQAMRRDLLAALKADGIDVDTLADKQVVERVSRWLLDRSRYLDKAFTTWFVHFPQGKPTIYPGLEEAFRRDFERDSRNYSWTLDQHLDHEVLGKGMFYNKTHGSCTSTAVYLTTVLRALGIPTRMILVAPAVDASDSEQMPLVKKAITHNRVRMTMLPGLNRASQGTTNHIFNEVYLGNRWCRLDYTQLGCSNFGLHRFGLQTHLYTFNDLSDANLAPTWGRRYAKGERNDVFRHDNPYTAVEVSELFGPHGQIPNPPFTAQELDPHPTPDVFAFCSSRVNVWDALIETVKSTTANKTGRYHDRESYDNLFDGTWLVRPQDLVILLFALDKPDRVPAGYEDLLPKPWPEIEAQLKQGQTVELSGKARERNVIVLAAPTAGGLKPLVQNSKLLQAIGGSSPRPAASLGTGATQTCVLPQSASEPVKLPDGVTVELLGVTAYPSAGRSWWGPDGVLLREPPYDRIGTGDSPAGLGVRFEFAVRVQNLPPGADITLGADHASSKWGDVSSRKTGARLENLHWLTATVDANRTTCTVKCGVAAEPWRTVAQTTGGSPGTHATDGGGVVMFTEAHRDPQRGTSITVADDLVDELCRIVAVTPDGKVEVPSESRSGSAGKLRQTTVYFSPALGEIKEFQFQIRPWTWVTYQGVSLRPGRRTNVTVEAQNARTTPTPSRRPPGQGNMLAIGPTWEILRGMLNERFRGSIGGFSTDPARTKQYFDELLSRLAPGDTFLLMFAFDRSVGVPPEDADLLPLPWSEIESRVKKGELVEAKGEARGLTVIVLAAPTTAQLDTLVRQTHLLDPFRADQPATGPAGPTQSETTREAGVRSSPPLAQLRSGVAVELVGVCQYPSAGRPWWRPDGSSLPEPPYDGIGGTISPEKKGAQFEFALHLRNLPTGSDTGMCVEDGSSSNGIPSAKTGARLEDWRWLAATVRADRDTCTLKCGVATEPWRTVARTLGTSPATRTWGPGTMMFEKARPGPPRGASLSVTDDLVEYACNIVAVLPDGTVEVPSETQSNSAGKSRHTTVSFSHAPAEIQEYRFQIRPWTWIEFGNVSLRSGRRTNVTVEVQGDKPPEAKTATVPDRRALGEEKEIVLPEADRQKVILDLTTGQLVPLPPVGPEPEKLEQALRKLGKGDLLYDCDSGDRTLILMRGATSEQAQGDTGEPPWKGYLIGPSLPGVITVKTAEGRQYKVTILAADDKACTLKYSLISTDPGAGGGARAEPPKAEPAPPAKASAGSPFSVYGVVTDPDGRPMAGVEVTVHCGVGTLQMMGETVTDGAGRYTLYFKPGLLSRDILLQAAIIHVRQAGFYEANLCRQGNLAMAGKMPSGEDRQLLSHYVGVVLPNQPREVNFSMRRAARIEGTLVDAQGTPLPGRTLHLTGQELYPATNVMASAETGSGGTLTMESIPAN